MKFTISWLRDHLEIEEKGKKLSNILTNLGLEVEGYKNLNDSFKEMAVCEIKKIEKHPNADRLKVCYVSTGNKNYKVVCGANNVSLGLKTIYAPNGTFIPGKNFILEKKSIRGVLGDGMLCSGEELNIPDESSGIIELDSKYKVGDLLSDYLKEEYIYQIGLTPNRGDCASVRGIARDLAAKINKKIIIKHIKNQKGSYKSQIEWKLDSLENKNDCPFIIGRHFKIRQNKESPNWLKKKLIDIGQSPISSLVDITNYILFDIGRPLHVFDANKIKGNLRLRRANDTESFIGLDKKKYDLNKNDLVITDNEKIVSLAGIMGGLNSCVDENTKEVFLEVAYFDPVTIARTGRRLNIMSDARYRFERGIDSRGLLEGLDKATELINKICGGTYSLLEEKGQSPYRKKSIKYKPKNFTRVVGYEIDIERQIQILESLEFTVDNKENDIFIVNPPSWRNDIDTENDVIEEITRIEGYDKIPYTDLIENTNHKYKSFSKMKNLTIDLREKAANLGLSELITFTLISANKIYPRCKLKDELTLSNPISSELSVMRNSLFPNLLDAAAKNFAVGIESINFFEIGNVFFGQEYDDQKNFLAVLKSGYVDKKNWLTERRLTDFFDLKSDISGLIDYLEIDKKIELRRSNSTWYHPGKSADILVDETKIGSFGELHPSLKKVFNLKQKVMMGELYLDKLENYYKLKSDKKPLKISRFLNIKKDFSFIISKDLPVQNLISVVKNSSDLIGEVTVFDIYDANLKGKKNTSVAIEVEIKQKEKIFNSQEINELMNRIIDNVKKILGFSLRD